MENLVEGYENAINIVVPTAKTDSTLKYYEIKDLDQRFKGLMLLYDKIEPNWKNVYTEVENQKPAEIQTPLGADSIEDVIDGALYDDVLEECLSMHIANKVAHQYEFSAYIIIENLLRNKCKEGKIPVELIDDRRTFRSIAKNITNLYDPIYEPSSRTVIESKRKLAEKGIKEEDIKELGSLGIPELLIAKKQAFAAKDYEISQSTKLLSKRKDISFGVCTSYKKDRTGRTIYDNLARPKEENSLVIDVPYYGQFSIHLKDTASISNFYKLPYYSWRYIYEKETVLLTDQISKQAQEIFEKTSTPTYKELRGYLKGMEKVNPRFAHYLAIKLGATKRELRDLHNGNER